MVIDSAEKNKEFIKKIEADGKGKLNFPFLTDVDSKVLEAYGIRDERYAGSQIDGIPRPTVVLIDKKRKVSWFVIEDDYKKRPTNADIRAEIDKLTVKKSK